MVSPRVTLAFVAATLTAVAACAGGGRTEKMGPGGPTDAGNSDLCVPGAQVECGCAGGRPGTQVCLDDGSGYGACVGCEMLAPLDAGSSPMDAGSSPLDTGSPADTSTPTDTGSPADTGGVPPAACPPGPIDLHSVTLYSNPPDLADWPVTTTLTEVDFNSDGVAAQFSKADGSGRWPDVVPPGWGGPLQYTIGMIECIGGAWYGSAVVEVWYGLPSAGGNLAEDTVSMAQCTAFGDGSTCQVAANWYYDAIRWGMLAGRQPATGETIGIFVAAGNLRNVTSDDTAQSPVMERSNVVMVPMPDISGATHSF